MRNKILAVCLLCGGAMATAVPVASSLAQPARQDLADAVQGSWQGDVTSDSRGSSRTGVTITVTKVGRNLVEISCDYDRIPTVRVAIMVAGNAIMNASPGTTFLIEQNRDPNRLDLYIDGAALIVRR